MNCPRCKSDNKIKAGFIKAAQRYKCKDCGYYFTVELKSTAKSISIKRLPCIYIWKDWGFVQ